MRNRWLPAKKKEQFKSNEIKIMKNKNIIGILTFSIVILNILGCDSTKNISKQIETEFEGIIKYENKIASKNPSENDINYYELFGDIETISYSTGNYLNQFPNGKEYIKTLYNKQSNNYYLFYRSGEVKYFSCLNESDKLIKKSKVKDEVICGYNCKGIKFDFGRFAMTYYYSESLQINPKHFENHKYKYFDELFKHSKSMYLKSIMETKKLQFVSTAVEVKIVKINKSTFNKPNKALKF
jgi:hypothetical protein